MMVRSLALVGMMIAVATPLGAQDALSGTLSDPGVVWISDGSHPAPSTGSVSSQRARAFVPDLLVVTAGSTIHFHNDDDVDHSVYSISPADPFDLGIYEPGPGKDVAFTKPGVLDVRCHIHRHMTRR